MPRARRDELLKFDVADATAAGKHSKRGGAHPGIRLVVIQQRGIRSDNLMKWSGCPPTTGTG